MAELVVNSSRTTLNGAIDNAQTTITVANTTGFPNSGTFRIRVDSEIMTVTGVSGNVWTVTRASEAVQGVQVARAHADKAAVAFRLTAGSLGALIAGGGGGSPGGATGNIQYNNSGAFAGNANLITNGSGSLTATGNITSSGGTVTGTNLSGTNTGDQTAGAGILLTGSVLSLDYGHVNVWRATQTINLNAASAPTASTGTGLQLVGVDATVARYESDAFGAIAAFTARRANGTGASPTAVLSGDQIGSFGFQGYYVTGGPGYTLTTANMAGYAAENWTSTAQGTKIVLRTTPIGSTTLTDGLTINPGGVPIWSGTLPANGDLAASQGSISWDFTNGSPAAIIKGKQANGTVFSQRLGFDSGGNLFVGGGGTSIVIDTVGFTGLSNIGIGHASAALIVDPALNAITTGDTNVAIGSGAMEILTTGNDNVGIGDEPLIHLTTGSDNVAIGNTPLFWLGTGNDNVAIGNAPLNQLVTGNYNIAIGNSAIDSIVTGSNNICVGSQKSAAFLTSGSNNVFIGGSTSSAITTLTNGIAIGVGSCVNNNNQCVFGGNPNDSGAGTPVCLIWSGATAPADGDLFSSQASAFWDFTPAAAKLKIKGKDSAGTVFNATFSGTSSGTNTGDQTTISGNAATATALQTARTINGVSFDGTANITVPAAAGTLTGTTLNATVVTSSLTSVGTLASGSIPFSLVTGGPAGANPSASIGLTAVNGSASTFTRSDGAPALSQAIAPTWTGVHTFAPTARSSGSAAALAITGPADTNTTLSTERNAVLVDLSATVQFATGALTTQRAMVVNAPTYSAVGASTITTAATLAINGPPTAGTNVTLTSSFALWVQSGTSLFNSVVCTQNAFKSFTTAAGVVSTTSVSLTLDATATLPAVVFGSSSDTYLYKIVGKVIGAQGGAGPIPGWLQNSAGRKRNTADVTNATATMSNLTDLSQTYLAGRKYFGFALAFANNTVGAEGLQFDLAGGTATFTSIEFGFCGTPLAATIGTATSTAAATAITATVVATTDVAYLIAVSFVINAAGTVIPRGAEVSHTTGTATFRLGSFYLMEDSPN